MFTALLRPQQDRRDSSERSPLLQSLRRVVSRQDPADSASDVDDGPHDEYEPEDEYEDEGENDEEDEDEGQRDEPLLPVFSEMLGTSYCFLCLGRPC